MLLTTAQQRAVEALVVARRLERVRSTSSAARRS
jgi:hypothetical protein